MHTIKHRSILVVGLALMGWAILLAPAALYSAEPLGKNVPPIGYPPGFEEGKRAAEEKRQALAEPSPAVPAPGLPNILTSFGMLDFPDGGLVPPDTHAAAGPAHIVEVVNSAVAFFNKTTGANLFQQSLAAFFAPVGAGTFVFDPVVAYDELAARFIVAALDVNFSGQTAHLLYAVSDTSNPLDGFTEMHRIDVEEFGPNVGENVWGDYPKVGWNADAHVFSLNMFGFNSFTFDHVSVITIDKATALDANAATLTMFDVNRSAAHFTMAAATMHGSVTGDPMWFVEEAGYGNGTRIRVVKMTDILSATPTFTDTNLAVASYTFPPNATQPGAGLIQTNDTRVLNAEWRENRLVASQAIGLPSDGEAHARWYEFSTAGASPTLTQQGTIDPGPGIHTYYPSIAVAANGDLGLTFMQSSTSEFMSMYVTGQASADPPGSMQGPALVKAGEANYTAFDGSPYRAGDYSGITVDPSASDVFCAANEYATAAATNNWGTWMGCFSLVPMPPLALDHFLCYQAKTTPNTPKFQPILDVRLEDQFEEGLYDVTKPLSLCNPADKRGEGILDPDTHLTGYLIKGPPHTKRSNIQVTNQFGTVFINTLKADRLLVPTSKSLTDPIEPPDPDSHDVDHYKCYTVKVTPGTPKFQPILGVSVVDQFNQPKLYDLKKPTHLCNPVDKNNEGIKDPEEHLLCYVAKPAKGQPKHVKVLGIHVNNQFGPVQLDTVAEEEICVPSTKTLPDGLTE